MPSVYVDLFGIIESDGDDGATLEINAQLQAASVPDDDALEIDATIDYALGEAAVPTGLNVQCAGMVVFRNGTPINPANMKSIEVSRDYDNQLQQWSFEVTLVTANSPLHSPFDHAGPSLCKEKISVYGAYLVGGTAYLIPLIKDGIADASTRDSSDGGIEVVSGVDSGGFYDQKLIDFVIPIGSGLDRAEAIKLIAEEAEVESINLPSSGRSIMKELQLADSQFLGPCQEMADVENRRLLWNRDGEFTWVKVGRQHSNDNGIAGTIDERRWVAGSVKSEHPGGEVVTRITADGDEQLPGQCTVVEVTQKITVKGLDGPMPLGFRQYMSGGSIAYEAQGAGTPWTEPQVTSIEVIMRQEKCKVLLFERRARWEYFNPESARYEWDSTASEWDGVDISIYTDDNSSGEEPAYLFNKPRWMLVAVDETWHSWFQTGFISWGPYSLLGPTGGWGYMAYPRSVNTWQIARNGTIVSPWAGVKIGTLSRSWGWARINAHVKDRSIASYPYAAWEEVEPDSGTLVTGDKNGVTALPTSSNGTPYYPTAPPYDLWYGYSAVRFTCVEERLVLYESDDKGYLTGAYERIGRFHARKGPNFLYGDGFEYADEEETFGFDAEDVTLYTANGEDQHDEIELHYDRDEKLYASKASTGLAGYLPAAERMPGESAPQDDLYEDEDQADELFIPSMRTDMKSISIEVIDLGLENCHVLNWRKLDSQYAENEAELEEMAWAIIDESAAARITGTVAGADFFIEPGKLYTLKHGKIGLNHTGRMKRVRWRWSPSSPQEPLNTEVEALVYHNRSN